MARHLDMMRQNSDQKLSRQRLWRRPTMQPPPQVMQGRRIKLPQRSMVDISDGPLVPGRHYAAARSSEIAEADAP